MTTGQQRRGSILVPGGAGYIGSHVVRQLGEAGEQVVVLDNLSTGFRSAVTHGELVVGDTGDRELVARLLKAHQVDTVIHFAAHTIVPESVVWRQPSSMAMAVASPPPMHRLATPRLSPRVRRAHVARCERGYPGGESQGTRCRRRMASVPAGQTTSRSPSSHRSRAAA